MDEPHFLGHEKAGLASFWAFPFSRVFACRVEPVIARLRTSIILTIGEKQYTLHPESEAVFFTTDRDLTFEFVKEGRKVSKVLVREHGAVVEEAQAE